MDMETSDSSELERTGAAADDAEQARPLQPPAGEQIGDSSVSSQTTGPPSDQGQGDVVPAAASNNPWPYLHTFFEYSGSNLVKKSVTYQCMLCKPRQVPITAHVSTLHNLKSHVKRAHPSRLLELQDLICLGSRRGQHNSAARERK